MKQLNEYQIKKIFQNFESRFGPDQYTKLSEIFSIIVFYNLLSKILRIY